MSLTAVRLAAAAGVLACGFAFAGPVEFNYAQPTLDRWMYPFNQTPGTEGEARIFAALGLQGFDDRDGQFLVGFETSAQVPTGLGASNYFVWKARLRLRVSQPDRFVYDPSFDSVATSFPPSHPGFVPDVDPGKPVELHGAGYRNGFTALTFCETCTFGGPPLVPPAEGARNVFAAIFDAQGVATDASRNVRQEFEAPGLAVGQTTAAAPGALVPQAAEFVFDIDLCSPGARDYLRRSLNDGVVNLVATTLLPVAGPGATDFPNFYTKENPIAQILGYQPKLELIVTQGKRSDFNNDGSLTIADFIAFQAAFVAGSPAADMSENCQLTVSDFVVFQGLFVGGL